MRIGAAIVAIVAAVALAAQWQVSSGLMADANTLAVAWRMLGYFTVLGNLATLYIMTIVALTGEMQARRAAAIAVVLTVIGLGYHILLAGIWAHQGLAWWADQGLHTAVPLLTVLWWAAFAPKSGLAWHDSLRWLIWPILYAGYAIVRGLVSGFYPYPFMDVTALGSGQVGLNVAGLGAAFVSIGVIYVSATKAVS